MPPTFEHADEVPELAELLAMIKLLRTLFHTLLQLHADVNPTVRETLQKCLDMADEALVKVEGF